MASSISFIGLFILLSNLICQHVVADVTCTDGSYTTINGMQFTVNCQSWYANFTGGSAEELTSIVSYEDCMDLCSVNDPLCVGTQWNSSTLNCWLITERPDDNSTISDTYGYLSTTPVSETTASDTLCGFATDQTTDVNGTEWKVTCDENLPDGDMYHEGSLAYSYHADSLVECMEVCKGVKPLCEAVVWNADMVQGWANCHPKNANSTTLSYGDPSYVAHTAEIILVPPNATCPGTDYTTSDVAFNVSCYKVYGQGNFTSVHADDLVSCLDACAANSTCTAVNWDLTLEYGYNNCYFMDSYGSSSQNYSFHSAHVNETLTSSSTTSSGDASTTSSSTSASSASTGTTIDSKGSSGSANLGWIAGPIIGGIAGIALIACLYLWLKGRKKAAASTPATSATSGTFVRNELDSPPAASWYTPQDQYSPTMKGMGELPAQVTLAEMSTDPPQAELPVENRMHEIDGNQNAKFVYR